MCNKRIVSGKNFIAIASVVFPVVIKTKLSDNFKLMRIIATQMIAHYSVNFDLIQASFRIIAL